MRSVPKMNGKKDAESCGMIHAGALLKFQSAHEAQNAHRGAAILIKAGAHFERKRTVASTSSGGLPFSVFGCSTNLKHKVCQKWRTRQTDSIQQNHQPGKSEWAYWQKALVNQVDSASSLFSRAESFKWLSLLFIISDIFNADFGVVHTVALICHRVLRRRSVR